MDVEVPFQATVVMFILKSKELSKKKERKMQRVIEYSTAAHMGVEPDVGCSA